MSRAQITMEYLMLIGLAMMLIVPSVYLYSERQKSYQYEIVAAQVSQIGNSIINNVNSIQTLGKGSKTVIEFNMPDGVNNISVMAGRELVFSVRTGTGGGDTSLVYVCQFCRASGPSINGTFRIEDALPGKKTFRLRACENSVVIERVIRNATGDFESTGPPYAC